jgi:hypothetical protein
MPMIKYALISLVISNVIMYPLIPLFRTPNRVRQDIRHSMHQGHQLRLLKAWGEMRQQNTVKSLIGIIILFLLILVCFYFTFGYCSIYKLAQKNFVMGWVFAILIDALVLEILIEFFIACMYCIGCGWLYKCFDAMRDFRALV